MLSLAPELLNRLPPQPPGSTPLIRTIPVQLRDFERAGALFLIGSRGYRSKLLLGGSNSHPESNSETGSAAPILVQVCTKSPTRCHSLTCPAHRIAFLSERLDRMAAAADAAKVAYTLRLPVPPGISFAEVAEAVRYFRRYLNLTSDGVELAWVVEPHADHVRSHVHAVLICPSGLPPHIASHPKPADGREDPLDRLATTLAGCWHLTPPGLDLSNPAVVRRAVWADTLPGIRTTDADGNPRDFAWQTRGVAARYALRYLTKRWRDPLTVRDHLARNGGKPIRFTSKWPGKPP